MMFFGTYRSEFYRLVRDLLHDHVSNGLSVSLQRRWNDLVMREAQFRRVEPRGSLEASIA